jgi:Na+/proline symporter
MEAYRNEITIGFVAVYMIFCVVVGLWAMRRTHTASDFFIAGRGLGPVVIALAVISTTLS